jgi:hypothetical protein
MPYGSTGRQPTKSVLSAAKEETARWGPADELRQLVLMALQGKHNSAEWRRRAMVATGLQPRGE